MEFTSFKTLVRDEVERRTGDDYSVRLDSVMKNNGVILSGLTVMQDDSNISPTIYLDNYYEAYENGDATLGMVINDVMDAYNKNKVNRQLDMRYFLNYESVREQIAYKLINTEKNKELLADVPHIEFLDLSIVFQCLISNEQIGQASVLIHNAHAKLWGVDAQKLYSCAATNTPRLLEYHIESMQDTLRELADTECGGLLDEDLEGCIGELGGSIPMYVLSNERRIDGAACMLYPDLIGDFARAMKSDLYIIPSSVHELLLLPVLDLSDGESIREMIREVNETQLLQEEILSDSLYIYKREDGKVSIFD